MEGIAISGLPVNPRVAQSKMLFLNQVFHIKNNLSSNAMSSEILFDLVLGMLEQ